MVQRKILFVILLTVSLCSCYVKQCPHVSQWNFRAKSFQCFQTTGYLCLYNVLVRRFEEQCSSHEEKARQGSKYVLSPNPDRVKCSNYHYQPFMFTSFGNSQCVYKKSKCNEEGQIVATNGSAVSDRKCRCDYTKNYVYVTKPNDICLCNPSEEDCSCYLKPCTRNNEVMISDYRCVQKDMIPPAWQKDCEDITRSSLPLSSESSTTRDYYRQFSETRISAVDTAGVIISLAALFILFALAICVNVRPYVKNTEVMYMEDLTVSENSGEHITVIGGEMLHIKCKFTSVFSSICPSILPVKSVAWKHTDQHGNVRQHKGGTVNSKQDQASYVIDEINADLAGRYECILTNTIGLSNNTFDKYPLIFNIFRNFPACRQEEKNYVDINVCSLPDEYTKITVLKGKDGTLEISGQNLTRLMWFKCEEKVLSIKSTDRYNGYTYNNPSLIIKAAKYTDVGRYVCVLVDKQDKMEITGFNFRVIPQEDIYHQMLQHRKDKTYVKTADVDKAMTCLHEYGTVILTGRKGTGKSTLCLELASLCEEDDYLPYVVDLSKDFTDDFGFSKMFCMIDSNEYGLHVTERLSNLLGNFLNQKDVRLAISCRSTDWTTIKTILKDSSLSKDGNRIYLNESLTSEEKKQILKLHMAANNIVEVSQEGLNFRSSHILNDETIQIKIDTRTIGEIVKTEPLHGFPLTAANFCKDRKLLLLGKKYFTNLPESLETEIFMLAEMKGSIASVLPGRMKYCILAYLATDETKCLDIKDINIERLSQLYSAIYTGDIRYVDVSALMKNAIKDLEGQFLIEKERKYQFIHHYVLKTIYVSHTYFTDYLIQKGSLKDIKEHIRSSRYKSEEGEMICKWCSNNQYINQSSYSALCRRLLTDASRDEEIAIDVGIYIYKQFMKLEDKEFREYFISQLAFRINLEKHLPDEKDKNDKSEEQIATENENISESRISFWMTVLLMDESTNHGEDPWLLLKEKDVVPNKEQLMQSPLEIPDIILLCGLIATCLRRKTSYNSCYILITSFKSKLQSTINLETLIKMRVDIYGNTFFHYLVILLEEESYSILETMLSKESPKRFSKDKKMQAIGIVSQTNKRNLTPLDMAAYLGKSKLFKLLVVNTKKELIDNHIEHLYKLTEEGRQAAKGREDKRIALNFEEGLLRYIKYGTEKEFLDILDLLKTTKLKKSEVRKQLTT